MSKYTEALSSIYFTMHNRVKPRALGHCEDKNLELLEELVERATPKKPYDKCDYYICPNCSNDRCVCGKFCPNCGQAIDWSVEDDS